MLGFPQMQCGKCGYEKKSLHGSNKPNILSQVFYSRGCVLSLYIFFSSNHPQKSHPLNMLSFLSSCWCVGKGTFFSILLSFETTLRLINEFKVEAEQKKVFLSKLWKFEKIDFQP